jgi:hypothetical protein
LRDAPRFEAHAWKRGPTLHASTGLSLEGVSS